MAAGSGRSPWRHPWEQLNTKVQPFFGSHGVLIDQAIYTSVRGPQREEYQLAAQSSGISQPETAQLSRWGPAHDSLLEPGSPFGCASFLRLEPQGRYVVGYTVAAGQEYSQRSGPRVYTHFLIVSSEDFHRFACNPFRILDAALARDLYAVHEPVPAQLEPLELVGSAQSLNRPETALLMQVWPLHQLARILDGVVGGHPTYLLFDGQAGPLLRGIVNLLPKSHRTKLSFTAGLRPSPRRPFQLHWVPPAAAPEALPRQERKHSRKDDQHLVIVDLHSQDEGSYEPQQQWTRHVLDLAGSNDLLAMQRAVDDEAAMELDRLSPAAR
jgi:hypothetical protein